MTLSHKVSMVSDKVGLSQKVVLSWRALWRSAHGCEELWVMVHHNLGTSRWLTW